MSRRIRMQRAARRPQAGATLIIALVLLLAMALMAVWGFNTSTTNMRAVGNTQARQEALNAAQTAIEATVSSTAFVEQPAAVAAAPVPVDLNGDGRVDYGVRLSPAPSCYRLRVVKTSELDATKTADVACMASSAAQNSGIQGAAAADAGNSLCADSEWNVRATVSDDTTGVRVAVNQGVALRGLVTDAVNSCP